MKKRDDLIRVFLILLVLLIYPLNFLVSGITACGNISNSVSLTQSIYIQNGTCFTIDTNNLYLNGSGFTVTGNTTGSFVIASDVVNITINNFNARNFTYFLNSTNVNESLFTGNNFSFLNLSLSDTTNLIDCLINVTNSRENTFSSNFIESNASNCGIILTGVSVNNSIINNVLNITRSVYGIYVDGSHNNISTNTLRLNDSSGIFIAGGNNTVSYNTILMNLTGSNRGIFLDNVSSSNTENNSIHHNEINFTQSSGGVGIRLSTGELLGGNNSIFSNSINVLDSQSTGISTGVFLEDTVIHSNIINYTNSYILGEVTGINIRGKNLSIFNNNVTLLNVTVTAPDFGGIIIRIDNGRVYSNRVEAVNIFANHTEFKGLEASSNQTRIFQNFINITGVNFQNSSIGIKISLSNNQNFSNNYVESRSGSVVAVNLSGSSNNTFFNNTIVTNDTNSYGFQLTQVQNISISESGIRTTGSSGYGIYLSATTFNITLERNNINTSGTNAHGIFLDRNSNGTVLLGNVVNTTGTSADALRVNGSHTNVSHNYFESRGDNAPLINVTATSVNNTFFNNTLFANGTNSVGVNLVNVVNQSLVSNTVRTYGNNGYGIYLVNNANNNSFVSNVFTSFGSAHSGYVISSRNNTFTSNNFTLILNHSDAFFISDANNTVLSFNTFNTSGVSSAGVRLDDTTGTVNGVTSSFNRIFTNNSHVNGPGINVFGAASKQILNINFTSENITTSGSNGTNVCANGADVLLNNISFTGLTANSKFLGFHTSSCSVDANSNVTVSWFVNFSVTSKVNGSSLPGASINITNGTGDSIQFTTANSNGQARFTLTEFIANSTRTTYVSPYNFTINYTGFNVNITTINLSFTNTTFFVANLSSSANTSTDAGSSSSGGSTTSSSSTGITVAPRSSDSSTSSEAATTTEAPAETTTTETTTTEATVETTTAATSSTVSVTAPSGFVVTAPVIATSVFVNPTTGTPVDNLAVVVGDFMPAAEAMVLNDIVLSLQQSAVVKAPIQKESFSMETPLLSLQLNNTLGSIKSLITSDELPGVLETSLVDGLGVDTKLDQFLNFNSSNDFDSNKVVFEANNQKIPGDYFFARDGQPIFTYTTKFQKGLQSRTNSVSTAAILSDLKDKEITLLGDKYVIGDIKVDTNGSLNNEISVELLKGGSEGMLYEGENGTFSAEGKDYNVQVVILTSDNSAVLKVNGESLPRLVIGNTAFTSSGFPVAIRDVIPNSGKKGKSLVRFYVGGKRVLLNDNVLNDTGFTRNALKVNNKQILDTAVRINGFFLDGTSKVVINTIDYELDASSKEGNLYIPAGQSLKQNLKQPEAIFSDNFDMKYNGLKKQPAHPVKFIPEGNNKYYLEFVNQEGLKYKIPLATVESDGNIRYGERSNINDYNLIFSEGTSNQDFVIQKNDYVLFSDIVSEGTLNTAGAFPVFNLGEMTDNFGFSKVMQYNNYDPTNKVLQFTDLAQNTKDNLYYAVVDNDNNATLTIEGNQYGIKVNASDSSLAADLNNDGFINGNFSIVSIQGAGLIVFGTKNPKKSSENAALQSINGTLNLTITTLAKRFSSGGTNFRAAFVLEPRSGGKIGLRKNETLGVSFVSAPTKDDPVSYALDGYGSYYTLINDSSSTSEYLQIDYPENQRTIDFKIEGTPKKDTGEIKEINSLPSDTTKLASQIDKLGQYNSVVIGSPCENPMAAKLLDHPTPCDKDLPENEALIKIFKYENNNIALLISGKNPELIKKTTDKITKGEILINLSQAILIKEPRDIDEAKTQTPGTVEEKVINEEFVENINNQNKEKFE